MTEKNKKIFGICAIILVFGIGLSVSFHDEPFRPTGINGIEYHWTPTGKAIKIRSGETFCTFSYVSELSCVIPINYTFSENGIHLELKKETSDLPWPSETTKSAFLEYKKTKK